MTREQEYNVAVGFGVGGFVVAAVMLVLNLSSDASLDDAPLNLFLAPVFFIALGLCSLYRAKKISSGEDDSDNQ